MSTLKQTNIPQEGKLEAKYKILRDLGKGAFGTVQLVQDRTSSTQYALKCIDRNAWQRFNHLTNRDVSLLDEVKIMKKINHANIVKVHEYFEEDTCVNVILDFYSGGDMLGYILNNGAYSSVKGRLLFKQLIEGVEYLHSLRIAHRDLKPENILLTDDTGDTLKICDFGISREQNMSGCSTIIGTPLYQAPEVIQVHHRRNVMNSNRYDGCVADYWSLGVILYVMLVAAPPFTPCDAPGSSLHLLELSEQHKLPWYDDPVPETAIDLIYKLLQDPKKRISLETKNHAYVMGYDSFEEEKKTCAVPNDNEEEKKSNDNDEKKNDIDDKLDVFSEKSLTIDSFLKIVKLGIELKQYKQCLIILKNLINSNDSNDKYILDYYSKDQSFCND
eukprot:712120_1